MGTFTQRPERDTLPFEQENSMRKNRVFSSLKARIWAFILALFLAVSLLLFYNNYHATNILRSRLYQTASEVLSVSQKRLSDTLKRTFSFLSTFIFENVDIKTLEDTGIHTTAFHNALERVKRKFANSLPIYTADSFFYYNPGTGLYFADLNTISHPMGPVIRSLGQEQWEKAKTSWLAVPSGKERYLLRAVKVSDSYIGAFVSIPAALEVIRSDQLAESRVYLMSDAGEVFAEEKLSRSIKGENLLKESEPGFVEMDGERWLATARRTTFGNYVLLALMRDSAVTQSLNTLTLVILAASLAAFLVITLGAAVLRRWILKPVSDLTASIRALQSGDFETTLPEATLEEFREVNTAFNEASERIEDMKIDLYEDRLMSQHIRMQYLQLQMPPHFLLNCLNTIYQLTEYGRLDLTRELIRTLSNHLRYTLTADKLVTLEEELHYADNYVQISKIRYPDSMELYRDYDPQAMDALVIPLLVLNFIENAIKFEAQIGKPLALYLSTRLMEGQVHLTMWDTGDGYGQAFLDDIADLPSYLERHRNEHIGIANVIARAKIANPGIRFRFSNRKGAGAQIEVSFPYQNRRMAEKT